MYADVPASFALRASTTNQDASSAAEDPNWNRCASRTRRPAYPRRGSHFRRDVVASVVEMMQPNVPYREGGPIHTGLPFPRANMTAYIVATALVAAAGLAMPLVLLGTKPARIFETLKEGGGAMWLLLLLMISTPPVVAVLAGLGIRGRKIPIAAIVGVAHVPALVAFAGTTLSHRTMARVLDGPGIDPSQKMRIAFEGTQEALASLQFGAAICAFSLGTAAVGCAGIAASVDRTRMNDRNVPDGNGGPGLGWIAALALPLLGFVGSLGLVVATRALGEAPIPILLSSVSLLVVAALAALTARSAGAFREFHDTAESKRMLGAVLAAAVMSALALWLLDRAAILSIQRLVFGACSGESVDAGQKARILMEGKLVSRAFSLLSGIHVVCALGAFVPALIAGSGKGKQPFGPAGTSALAVVVLAALGFVVVGSRAKGYIASTAAANLEPSYPVTLPTVQNGDTVGLARGYGIVVDKFGKGSASPSSPYDDYLETHTFAADKDAFAAAVFALDTRSGSSPHMPAPYGETRVELLVVPETPVDLPREIDPEIRAMIAPESLAVSMQVDFEADRPEDHDRRMPSVTFVDEQSVHVRTRSSSRGTKVRFGPDFGARLRTALGSPGGGGVGTAYLTLLPTTRVGALVTVISSLGVYRGAEVHVRVARNQAPATSD